MFDEGYMLRLYLGSVQCTVSGLIIKRVSAMIKMNKCFLVILRYLMLVCVCLPLLTGCGSQRVIVNALPDEREANEILVFLSSKGIDATKQASAPAGGSGGGGGGSKQVLWNISVEDSQALDAMSYLNQAGLPRKRSQSLLNIFTGAGLVPSEMEQKIRYQAGLAEQIGSTLRKMDGILDAEVQLSFPEEDPMNPTKKKTPITASVFIKHNGILDDPNAHLTTKIKRLVSAAVPNLDFGNVTVVGERARYNDIPGESLQGDHGDSIAYVTVWSMIIDKNSLPRFRIIFFSLIVLILLLVITLIWMSWKVYPMVKKQGFRKFLRPKPFPIEKDQPPVTKEKEVKETEVKEKEITEQDKDANTNETDEKS